MVTKHVPETPKTASNCVHSDDGRDRWIAISRRICRTSVVVDVFRLHTAERAIPPTNDPWQGRDTNTENIKLTANVRVAATVCFVTSQILRGQLVMRWWCWADVYISHWLMDPLPISRPLWTPLVLFNLTNEMKIAREREVSNPNGCVDAFQTT